MVDDLAEGLRSGRYLRAFGDDGGVAGYVFTNPVDGTTSYGIVDPTSGRMMFTQNDPFSGGVYGNAATGFITFGDHTGQVRGKDGWAPVGTYVKPGLTVASGAVAPFLTGTTVAPGDLLALAESGDPRFGRQHPDDMTDYAQRVREQERLRQIAAGERDRGLEDKLGIGRDPRGTTGGGGDLSQGVVDALRAASDLAQQRFNAPKARAYVPGLPKPPKAGIGFGPGFGFGPFPGRYPTFAPPSLKPPPDAAPPPAAPKSGTGGKPTSGRGTRPNPPKPPPPPTTPPPNTIYGPEPI